MLSSSFAAAAAFRLLQVAMSSAPTKTCGVPAASTNAVSVSEPSSPSFPVTVTRTVSRPTAA